MKTNNRTSNLPEITELISIDPTFAQPTSPPQSNQDDEVLFMLAISGERNEKIKFKNLKKSILDESVLLHGDQTISGKKIFKDPCDFQGGVSVKSYTVEDYIYHTNNDSTNIHFEKDKITLSASKGINIDVGEKFLNISESGNLSINTHEELGVINASGDAYFDNIYVKDSANDFVKVSPYPEDSVNFCLPLASGIKEYTIDFPKTFEEPPAVYTQTQGSGDIQNYFAIPSVITEITQRSYTVHFAAPIPNDSYKIHTLAKPTGEHSFRQTKTVSMIENLQSGQSSFKFNYPEAFEASPMLSTNLESDKFIIPYLITESNENFLEVLFVSELPADAKFHIHATR
jgi:hypothetical protein